MIDSITEKFKDIVNGMILLSSTVKYTRGNRKLYKVFHIVKTSNRLQNTKRNAWNSFT